LGPIFVKYRLEFKLLNNTLFNIKIMVKDFIS
jgi:hypothetical protein